MQSNVAYFSFMNRADAILLTDHHIDFIENQLDLVQAQRQCWRCLDCNARITNLNNTAYVPYTMVDKQGQRSMAGYVSCLACNDARKAGLRKGMQAGEAGQGGAIEKVVKAKKQDSDTAPTQGKNPCLANSEKIHIS